MRTETIDVYSFYELDDDAKERALEALRSAHEYYWHRENRESLEEFCKHFDVELGSWEYSLYASPHISGRVVDEELAELKRVRLWKWLGNSGILDDDLLTGNCPFTGYYMDEELLDPIRDFMKKPLGSLTWQGLIDECLWRWATACSRDLEYSYSSEALVESADANDLEFTKTGEIFV